MSGEERALQRITREARFEAEPDCDWEAIEERLMAEVSSSDALSSPLPKGHLGRPWTAIMLAAAGFCLMATGAWVLRESWLMPSGLAQAVAVPSDAPPSAALDSDQLVVGTLITSGAEPREIHHPGRAHWRLGPQGRARIGALGPYLTVVLESGWIEAEVVPSPRPESFAVEVGRTRVAVKGTRFRVEPSLDQVKVSVSRGIVVVGEAGHPGMTQGVVLRSPTHRVFDRTGQVISDDPTVDTASTSSGSSALPQAQKLGAAGQSGASSSEGAGNSVVPLGTTPEAHPLHELVSARELAALGDRISAHLQECFRAHTVELEKVRVNAESTASFEVAPSGALARLSFVPPFAPPVETCVRAAVQSEKISASTRGGSGSVDVWLRR